MTSVDIIISNVTQKNDKNCNRSDIVIKVSHVLIRTPMGNKETSQAVEQLITSISAISIRTKSDFLTDRIIRSGIDSVLPKTIKGAFQKSGEDYSTVFQAGNTGQHQLALEVPTRYTDNFGREITIYFYIRTTHLTSISEKDKWLLVGKLFPKIKFLVCPDELEFYDRNYFETQDNLIPIPPSDDLPTGLDVYQRPELPPTTAKGDLNLDNENIVALRKLIGEYIRSSATSTMGSFELLRRMAKIVPTLFYLRSGNTTFVISNAAPQNPDNTWTIEELQALVQTVIN